MSCLIRRAGLAQALARPRCYQPLLRRAFTASPHTRDEAKPAENETPTPPPTDVKHQTSGSKDGRISLNFKSSEKARSAGKNLILKQDANLPIRARFAPSPTGYLHLGSLRTALFNKLAATASNGGSFILRIEDTDQNRRVKDAEERLMADLKWAGLEWDEGPDRGGPHGPYRQSERLDIYNEHIDKLLENGHAYRCFCVAEDLHAHNFEAYQKGQPTIYPGTCRSVPRDESDRQASEGKPHVVRLNSQLFGRPTFDDAIHSRFQQRAPEHDFILRKTDGYPTYHFANVVDDHLMQITHVIRGDEWLISTPKHIALYKAFGWKPPVFAHVALLVEPDGSKLSKRNDSIDIAKYRDEENIMPMALLTWLAGLGGTVKPGPSAPRTIGDLAEAFTFKFTKGGVKLNPDMLDHLKLRYQWSLFSSESPPTDRESELIEQHYVQPILRHIDAITSGTSTELPSPPWHQPQELVSALAPTAPNRGQLIRKILSFQHKTTRIRATTLVQKVPYLLWRVPTSLYRASIAEEAPDARILAAFEEAVADPENWVERAHGKIDLLVVLREALREITQDKDILVHDSLRLILAGSGKMSSLNTGVMLRLLGKDEVAYRVSEVKRLLGEMSEAAEAQATEAPAPSE